MELFRIWCGPLRSPIEALEANLTTYIDIYQVFCIFNREVLDINGKTCKLEKLLATSVAVEQ